MQKVKASLAQGKYKVGISTTKNMDLVPLLSWEYVYVKAGA